MVAHPRDWSVTAREFLSQLQASAWRRAGANPDNLITSSPKAEEKLAQFQMSLDNTLDYAAAIQLVRSATRNDELPTPYEMPMFYNLLLAYAADLETAATHLQKSLSFNPLIGTIPSGRLNAMAVSVPNTDEFLILFEAGLFGFLNLLSKVFASVLTLPSAEERIQLNLEGAVEPTDADVKHFVEAFASYVVDGHPMLVEPWLPEKRIMPIHTMLLTAIELFVMGHEFGHVIEGHFDKKTITKSAIADTSTDECLRDWRQELSADLRGLELSLKACELRQIDIRMAFVGATMFFDCARLLEITIAVLSTGDKWMQCERDKINLLRDTFDQKQYAARIIGSHPPPMLRQERLKEIFSQSFPKAWYKATLVIADRVSEIAIDLWSRTLPTFVRMHAAGIRPSRIWQ